MVDIGNDVIKGRVAEVSISGHMFKLDIEAVQSRTLRPWERHGPTNYWFTFEDFHNALPAIDQNVTLHLRPGTTTILKMEVEKKRTKKAQK